MKQMAGVGRRNSWLVLAAFCSLVLCRHVFSQNYPEAQASVNTFFTDGGIPGGSDFPPPDPNSVSASASGNYMGASAAGQAVASGPVDIGDSRTLPYLGASATGQSFMDDTLFISANANAAASFQDVLTYEDPSRVTNEILALSPYLYFVHDFHGTASNQQGAAFGISVVYYDNDGNQHVIEQDQPFTGPGEVSTTFTTLVPAEAFLNVIKPVYHISLSVGGGTDQNNVDGTTNFFNTAALKSVYIADANGNFIPGTENIQIVGASGIEYAMTVVPEPATWILLVCGLSIGTARLRPRYREE